MTVVKVNRFVMAKGEDGDEEANLSVKGLRRHGSCKDVRRSQEYLVCEGCSYELDLAEEWSQQERR